MQNVNKAPDQKRRRQIALGLFLAGLGMILAVMWGLWSFLHNESGVLIVTSRPSGAEVVLNRRPTDLLTTAFFSDLPADSFVVSARMDGYRPVPPTQGVTIKSWDTTRVTFIMAPIARGDKRPLPIVSGTPHNWKWRVVMIKSDPEDAALIADDRELGVRTPVTLLFEPGLHHLQAVWADGARSFKNISIDPDLSQADVTMRPMTYEKFGAAHKDTTR
jgi:hypothetical protein